MGTFKVTVQIGDPAGLRFESVEALVDTGASYSVIPASTLDRLHVPWTDTWPFELADGRVVQRDVGQTVVRVDGRSTQTIVVFGDDGTSLLGAYTLEGVRMAADPVRRRLIPVPGLLMSVFDRSSR